MAQTEIGFVRNTRANINKRPIKDGNIYFTTDTEEILMDYAGSRKLFTKNIKPTRLDISSTIQENLTSQNFKQAFSNALSKTKYLYIPDGTYDLKIIGMIDIGANSCDVLCSSGAKFIYQLPSSQAKNAPSYLIRVQNSEYFKWEGGTFEIGNANDKIMYYNKTEYLSGSTFFINKSKNIEFKNVNFKCSHYPNAISFQDSENINVKSCKIDNILSAGIHIFRSGKNICIDSCRITNIKIPTNYSDDIWYCYAICTGLNYLSEMNGSEAIVPPDNLIVRNCFVENSEDSGIDTHGATNVIIENNKIINTGVCITAYNDSNRVKRPDNWVMENIIIRNNFCKSTVSPPNRPHGSLYYPDHSYVMVSSSKKDKRDSRNYFIYNNYFESTQAYNDYGYALMPIVRLTNVKINNCVFKMLDSKGKHAIYARYSNNVEVSNCSLIDSTHNNDVLLKVDDACSIKANNNNSITGITVQTASLQTCSHVETDDYNYYFQQTLRKGEFCTPSNIFSLNINYYICNRLIDSEKQTRPCRVISTNKPNIYEITISGHHPYFHGCGVILNNTAGEVVDILGDNSFLVRTDDVISTGTQNIKMKDVNLLQLQSVSSLSEMEEDVRPIDMELQTLEIIE